MSHTVSDTVCDTYDRTMSWHVVLRSLIVACLLIAAGCAAGSDENTVDENDIIVEAEPTPETFDASDPEQLAGVSTSPNSIEAGDCFNEYVYRDRTDFLQQITTIVGCNGPHDREAYFRTDYPADEGEPAPPDETLRRWGVAQCLDQFESFVGLEYVLSLLEIGVIVPTFESWTDNNDRGIICYVYPDEPGRRLKSSVRDSEL